MALLAKVTSLDEIDANLHGYYERQDDGSYLLAVKGVDGYRLENVDGLQNALSRQKEEAKAAKAAAKAWAELGDSPDEVREALAKLDELSKANPDEQVKKLAQSQIDQLTAKHAKELEKLTGELKASRSKIEDTVAGQAIAEALASAQVVPSAVDDLRYLLRRNVKVSEAEDGSLRAVVVGPDGTPLLSTETGSGTKEMSIAEYIASQRDTKPHWFPAEQTGGGGAKPTNNSSRPAVDPSTLSPIDMMRQGRSAEAGRR